MEANKGNACRTLSWAATVGLVVIAVVAGLLGGGYHLYSCADTSVTTDAAVTPPPYWRGLENDKILFVLTDPRPDSDARIIYTYTEISSARPYRETERGSFVINPGTGRMKGMLLDAGGNPVRSYDGTFTADYTFVGGLVYPVRDGMTDWDGAQAWWATLEPELGEIPPATIALNTISVGELELSGFPPTTARALVAGRLRAPYTSVEEARSAPGLSENEKAVLLELGHVD